MRYFFFAGILIFLILIGKNLWALSADKSLTILALGDSTTAGTPAFLSPAESPPRGEGDEKSQYAYWITQKHPAWKVLNRGVRSQRSDQILWRFKRELSVSTPDVVIVLAGVNDLYQEYSAEHVKEMLKKIYDFAVEKKARVMACTILPYNSSTPEIKQRISEVNDWIRLYAKEHQFLFCDTSSLLEDPKNPGNLIGTPDGLHPDVEGYRKMGEAIAAILTNAFSASP